MAELNNEVYGGMSSGRNGSSVEGTPELIKVSARSRSTAVAGAIAGVVREYGYADIQAIGAGAVNQAVKAMAIARGYLDRDEIEVVFTPHFTEVDIDGQERTAVRFSVDQVNPR
jgi:stage V sporulation protein S